MKKLIALIVAMSLLLTSCGFRSKNNQTKDDVEGDEGPQIQPYSFNEVKGSLKEVFTDQQDIEFIMIVKEGMVYVRDGALYLSPSIDQEAQRLYELTDYEFMLNAGKNFAIYENENHRVFIRWKDNTHQISPLEIMHRVTRIQLDEDNEVAYYISDNGNGYSIVELNLITGQQRVLAQAEKNNVIVDFNVADDRSQLSYITYGFDQDVDLEDEYIWYYGEYVDRMFIKNLNTDIEKEVVVEKDQREGDVMRLWDLSYLSQDKLLVSLIFSTSMINATYIYDLNTEQFTRLKPGQADLWTYYISEDGQKLIAIEGQESEDWLIGYDYNIWYYNVAQDKYTKLTQKQNPEDIQQDRRPILNEKSNYVAFERWMGYVIDKDNQYQERVDLMITDLKGNTTTLVEGFVALSIVGWLDENTLIIVAAKEKEEDFGFYTVTLK